MAQAIQILQLLEYVIWDFLWPDDSNFSHCMYCVPFPVVVLKQGVFPHLFSSKNEILWEWTYKCAAIWYFCSAKPSIHPSP